jgi:two-component system, cell cycle response regulator DivK
MSRPLVLVVEDDPQLSQIFTITLSKLFEVEAITDGAQAMLRLSEVVPHLMVLDLNLPGVSGAQILHAVRADSRFDATRVILATANARHADELQDKADIVLLKPVSPSQLRDLAERLK